jgi:hypothetical protein
MFWNILFYTGFPFFIILLGKICIYRAKSVEMLQIGKFWTLARHQSQMEGCIAKGNSKMSLYWERWALL